MHVLITGGAGFVGSHLADRLSADGHRIRVLDNLEPQVHGENARRPTYLPENVELWPATVCDRRAVSAAIEGVDVIFHDAAVVGVGQSMYQVRHYTEANILGTATLLDVLAAPCVRHCAQRTRCVAANGNCSARAVGALSSQPAHLKPLS
jgi:dTDP-L-rhamnose 4-epimerase